MKKTALFLLMCALWLTAGAQVPDRIDLSGTWQFSLDRQQLVHPDYILTETVRLPGTTDTNRKGDPLTKKDETTHLSRPYSYKGRAWYKREVVIPEAWRGLPVVLFLERTKPSEVYVDAQLAGSSNDISTPQVFNLSQWLTPGHHTLAIMVDNSSGVPEQLYASSHAYTEDTQTNWNGIIGTIALMTNADIPCAAVQQQRPTDSVPTIFRNFHIEGQQFVADNHPVFLRGRHDACVWPLTGHVAMDVESWRWYMAKCREYGLNHVRFHSWCPPEAAFAAADEAGIILQPELPFWGDFNAADSVLMTFLHKEGLNILRWYGHHPSFRMMALGNELWGSIEKMADFIADFRRIAPDKLYTFGSNYYLGYQGVKPGMDYFTTCRVGGEGWGNYNTHTRGSFSFADAMDGGMINHFRPNSSMNFEEACTLAGVPVISHETAQFQTYPDYREIEKYTGALYPCNMEVFKSRLEQAGMADQAETFHRASGHWSMQLYKQDVEMDLRTKNMAGFQLLDLQDYPGQGSAYVGVLDAFQDSKGLISSESWRQFCSEVVPLAVLEKFCFTNDERLTARMQVANYGGCSLQGKVLTWQLAQQSGRLVLPDGEGLIEAGTVDIGLSAIKLPEKLLLTVAIEGTPYKNSWPVWVYPAKHKLASLKKKVIITREMTDEIGRKLENGASVLLMPDTLGSHAALSRLTVGGLFQTDYWNYRMFKTISENNKKTVSPGTLGILCNPAHPLFRLFPTDEHTSWQWFPVVKQSRPFMLDNTGKDYRPVVQVIDNIERNHKLGLVFEFQVGKGRLLVVMSDLEKAAEWPEGRQFFVSVLSYMRSKDFQPETKITLNDFRRLMTTDVVEGKIGELNNISPY